MALDFVQDGPVAILGLNRPREKNALDPALLQDLHRAWRDVSDNDAVRAVILRSSLPDIFCSGMDLGTAIPVLTGARRPENDAEQWLAEAGPQVGEAMLKPNLVKKPVIVAVHGRCLTGGFEMVMGADLRLASDDAIFQMREVQLGIMPVGGANVYLPRLLSSCRGLEILLTGEDYDAQTLREWGFLNRVVPKTRLMDEALAMAGRIADNGPLAVQGIIRCWRETHHLPPDEAFARERAIGLPIFGSADAREGIRAQRERRKPNFPGSGPKSSSGMP